MPDDPRKEPEPSDSDVSDFDDWLSAESAPPTDPLVASSEGEDDTEGASIFEAPGAAESTGEIALVEEPESFDTAEAFIEFEPFDGGADADTGELEVISGGEDEDADQPPLAPVTAGVVSFGDLWGDAVTGETETIPDFDGAEKELAVAENDLAEEDPVEEFMLEVEEEFSFGEGDGLHGTTREHAGLAEAIAAADSQDTEQVALVAEIPGLEPTVVGFEDVVEAEGHRKVRARASGDLIARVITGVVLVAALAASLFWRPALVVLAIAVFVLGAGEFYTALLRSERAPISLFGFIGIIGASLGAYWWNAAAIPIAFILATVLLLLFYAVVPGKVDPMGNLALTTTVMVWAGLGSFAMLIARSDDYQTLILGVVLAVAGADVAAFFVGRSLGRTHFAPWVSPNKTVEGLVAGTLVAIAIGAFLHYFEPFELTSGLAIGAVAAIFTPLGDLAMSAAKRSLGLKDMGSVLPGHGGFLDRIDGLLFAIPAAWAVFVFAGLL